MRGKPNPTIEPIKKLELFFCMKIGSSNANLMFQPQSYYDDLYGNIFRVKMFVYPVVSCLDKYEPCPPIFWYLLKD